MTDTTCKEMLGCYGNKNMRTPNLDALAAEGIRYENAYTCQPVCGPARSAIFTGLFPHSNGMTANGLALGSNVKTIGQRLTDCGIHCGYIGKWHLDGGDYFGLPVPKLLEGKSMLPQIYDTKKTINDAVFTEFTRYETDHDGFGGLQLMRAVISEHHKLALHLLDKDEFYYLRSDPDELHNRIEDESCLDLIKKYHELLIRHINETRDPFRGYQWSYRPWNKGFTPGWNNEGFTRQKEDDGYEPRQLDYV